MIPFPRLFAATCSPRPEVQDSRAPPPLGPDDGRERGRASKRDAGPGPGCLCRATVYPQSCTAEDAPWGLVTRGSPDPRGEKRGGDARRRKGAVPAPTRSAAPLMSRPGLYPRRAGRKSGPTNGRLGRRGQAAGGGHAWGLFFGSAGVEAGQVSKPHSPNPVTPAPFLRLWATHPPAHTSSQVHPHSADKGAALRTESLSNHL